MKTYGKLKIFIVNEIINNTIWLHFLHVQNANKCTLQQTETVPKDARMSQIKQKRDSMNLEFFWRN